MNDNKYYKRVKEFGRTSLTRRMEDWFCVGEEYTLLVRRSNHGTEQTLYMIDTYPSRSEYLKAIRDGEVVEEKEFSHVYRKAKEFTNKVSNGNTN